MAIVKVISTVHHGHNDHHLMFNWLSEKEVLFSINTIATYRGNIKAETWVQIHDDLIAIEFLFIFNGISVSDDEYNAEMAVRTVGNLLSR